MRCLVTLAFALAFALALPFPFTFALALAFALASALAFCPCHFGSKTNFASDRIVSQHVNHSITACKPSITHSARRSKTKSLRIGPKSAPCAKIICFAEPFAIQANRRLIGNHRKPPPRNSKRYQFTNPFD